MNTGRGANSMSTDTEALEFRECPDCAAKPGLPVLCPSCCHNRAVITKLSRRPARTRSLGLVSESVTLKLLDRGWDVASAHLDISTAPSTVYYKLVKEMPDE
jgi:hypothetical protein